MAEKKQPDPWQDASPCCKGCLVWAKAKKDCWYFWEGKKHCTMWAGTPELLAQRGQ